MLLKPSSSRRARSVSTICGTEPISATGSGAELLGRQVEQRGQRRQHLVRVLDDLHRCRPALELQVAGALAGRLPGPPHPVRVLLDDGLGGDLGAHVPGRQARHDAHRVGVPAGQRQDPLAPAADEERRPAGGDGGREALGLRDPVVLPGEGGAARAPHGLQDLEALRQAGDAHRRALHRDPRLLVVGRLPAGAQAELEAAAGHDVEGRRLPGENDGMAEVVVEDQRPDTQRGGGLGGDGQGDHGSPLVVQVIGHVERRVAQVLRLARQVTPLRGGCGVRGLQREPEGGHGRRSYGVNLVR